MNFVTETKGTCFIRLMMSVSVKLTRLANTSSLCRHRLQRQVKEEREEWRRRRQGSQAAKMKCKSSSIELESERERD